MIVKIILGSLLTSFLIYEIVILIKEIIKKKKRKQLEVNSADITKTPK